MRYDKIRYPDGQISVKITDRSNAHITERINSYEDLIFIKSIAEAYHHSSGHAEPLTLFIPCLFGQRSDRRFSESQSFDLKIIADIINSCNFSRVGILDSHSDVSLALINNSHKVDPLIYIKQCIDHEAVDFRNLREETKKDIVLISPDGGSYKKVFSYGEILDIPVAAANKHRDLNGKINLNFTGDVKDKTCLICDDLLDAGGTFIALAKFLKEQGASKIYLYISHGFFNKGFDELKKYIDHIYCTNSVKDIENDFITQYKVI